MSHSVCFTLRTLTDRHIQALRIIGGRGHGTGHHRPEDLQGLDNEVEDLIRDGLARLTPFGRAARLTRDGEKRLDEITGGQDDRNSTG